MKQNDFIEYFLYILTQIKVYHWTTRNYPIHKALGDLYESLDSKVDHLIEVYIGFFNSNKTQRSSKINTSVITDNGKVGNVSKFLEKERKNMDTILKAFNKVPEIQNIIQDIMASVDNTIYLCSLSK